MSPPPKLDDLVPATISGSGMGASRPHGREISGLDFLPERRQFGTSRLRPVDELLERPAAPPGRGCGTTATRLVGLGESAKKPPASPAHARDRPRPRPICVEVHGFALGTQAVEAGRVASGFAPGEDARRLAQPIAGGRDLLSRDLCGRPGPRTHSEGGAHPSDLVVGSALAGDDQRGRSLTSRSRRPVIGSGCVTSEHVLGDAGHRLAVERQPGIRPSAGREHVCARDIDAP